MPDWHILKLFTALQAAISPGVNRLRRFPPTDGTPAGTVLVRDIAPGAASSNPSSLVAASCLVYFAASDPVPMG